METSKLFLMLGGSGAVGTVGIGILGWQLLPGESSTPTAYALDDMVLNENPSITTFRDYGCFKKFFEGAQVDQTENSINAYDINDSGLESLSNSDETGGYENSVGCALVKMYHDESKPKWTLSGEIAIKGDRRGLVLWFEGFGKLTAESSTNSTDYSQELAYRLVLLEKDEDGDFREWGIKAGYAWKDEGVKANAELKIYVSVLDKLWANIAKNSDEIEGLIKNRRVGANAIKQNSYQGIWESGVEGGSAPFSGIKVGGKAGEENVLGKTGEFSGISLKNGSGLVYNSSTTKWNNYVGGAVDISNKLNAWYKPLRELKGRWRTLDEYCLGSGGASRIEGICQKK